MQGCRAWLAVSWREQGRVSGLRGRSGSWESDEGVQRVGVRLMQQETRREVKAVLVRGRRAGWWFRWQRACARMEMEKCWRWLASGRRGSLGWVLVCRCAAAELALLVTGMELDDLLEGVRCSWDSSREQQGVAAAGRGDVCRMRERESGKARGRRRCLVCQGAS